MPGGWLTRPIALPRTALLAWLLLAASLTGLAGRLWWGFDLAAHFPLHYALGLVTLAPLLWWQRWRRLALLALVVALAQGSRALDWYQPTPAAAAGAEIRVFLLNLQRNNTAHQAVLEAIATERADIVVLLEVNRRWAGALQALHGDYPHRRVLSAEDNFGIALYSRYPLAPLAVRESGPWGLASILAGVNIQGQRLMVYATHPPPPLGKAMSTARDAQLAAVADELALLPGPRLLAGDLNATPWSAAFAPLQAAGLRDSTRGFAYQGSWPHWLGGWGIPLDHLLVSADIAVLERRLGPALGSDHLPVLATLQLSASASTASTAAGSSR